LGGFRRDSGDGPFTEVVELDEVNNSPVDGTSIRRRGGPLPRPEAAAASSDGEQQQHDLRRPFPDDSGGGSRRSWWRWKALEVAHLPAPAAQPSGRRRAATLRQKAAAPGGATVAVGIWELRRPGGGFPPFPTP